MWCDTVLASKIAYGIVIYSGKETRMSMSKKSPKIKMGKTDAELNFLSKLLFSFMLVLAVISLLMKYFH